MKISVIYVMIIMLCASMIYSQGYTVTSEDAILLKQNDFSEKTIQELVAAGELKTSVDELIKLKNADLSEDTILKFAIKDYQPSDEEALEEQADEETSPRELDIEENASIIKVQEPLKKAYSLLNKSLKSLEYDIEKKKKYSYLEAEKSTATIYSISSIGGSSAIAGSYEKNTNTAKIKLSAVSDQETQVAVQVMVYEVFIKNSVIQKGSEKTYRSEYEEQIIITELQKRTEKIKQLYEKDESSDNSSIEENDDVFVFVPYDEPPTPIGGFAAIQNALVYPKQARKARIEGRVTVQAQIDVDGTVSRTKVVQSLGPNGCDEAAVDALKAVSWKPAKHKDRAVKVWITVPVDFKLR